MTAHDRIDQAGALLDGFVERDVPLAPLTTYRVGGSAALMARPRTLDDLHGVAKALAITELPVLVVGRGSNLLVADSGFHGIAVRLDGMTVDGLSGPVTACYRVDGTQVVASASTLLPQLARRLVAESLTGFEWAVGVPGSIGGAVRMNAGGHGSDMQACLVDVQLFDLTNQFCGWVDAGRLGLRFRGSDLAGHQVVLQARIQLAAGDREASQRELDEIVRWRREKQPGGQNAGSVFVNPIPGELAAGELVERVGLRGFTYGTAAVSDKHANFIQGSDGGTAADVLALIELVRARVAAETGFVLRSEVRLVGFDDAEQGDEAGVAL
ncbi:MAG: murB [Ilumatobacteraceae bacterium]|nr:murB [Ilumatobacteraceae bacterium]